MEVGKIQNQTKEIQELPSSQQEGSLQSRTHLNFISASSNEVLDFDHHVLKQILFNRCFIVIYTLASHTWQTVHSLLGVQLCPSYFKLEKEPCES